MGSILRGDSFEEEKRKSFVKAFSGIPQRVLWKWEGNFPEKSNSIMNLEWMPQRDILGLFPTKIAK
jgi:glucuronosyltransferase